MTNPTPDVSALLPCPFCGETPTLAKWCGHWGFAHSNNGCLLTADLYQFDTEAEAITAWNTRPTPTPADQEAHKLRADAEKSALRLNARAAIAAIPDRAMPTPAQYDPPAGIAFVPRDVAARQLMGLYYELSGMPEMAEAVRAEDWELGTGFEPGSERELILVMAALVEAVRKEFAAAPDLATLRTQLAERDETIAGMRAERDTPEIADWAKGVQLEATHQRARWGSDHDAGKSPLDWFWLIGYLAQKAADAHARGDIDKAAHHTISTGAALANWHLSITGIDNSMRPGIDPRVVAQAAQGNGPIAIALGQALTPQVPHG